jgi:hypothetical protein
LDNLKLYWKPFIKLKRKLSCKEGFEEATYTVREGLQYAQTISSSWKDTTASDYKTRLGVSRMGYY